MAKQTALESLTVGAVIWMIFLFAVCSVSEAARISDIRNTKHNLSASGPGTVKATLETRICVFCHTPHYAENIPKEPLWNRSLSSATYTPYTSNSLNAIGLDQPDGASKLCLSCHDGTTAIGAVNVLNGSLTDMDPSTEDITMQGVASDKTMPSPSDSGDLTGFTADLGTTLTNDHPISFTYDTAMANNDGELYDPNSVTRISKREALTNTRPTIPLEPDASGNPKLQCISCHDPHIRDDTLTYNIKFLRLNRFQKTSGPSDGSFSQENDIMCLGCHDKKGWQDSAHAQPSVADEQYDATGSTQRDFPSGIKVWEASCLNCHDTHTARGSRRLLREGTDSAQVPKSGGNSAIEETCYQCHSDSLTSILTNTTSVPNIKDIFTFSAYRMPITTGDQPAGSEIHDISGADLTEDRISLGKGNLTNRHAECTDCHNPHRVIKNDLFNDNPGFPDASGTHNHSAVHSNIASGVLRGIWGVEPNYGGSITYTEKSGYGGVGASSDSTSSYVTREYQICLKCHSDYAYNTPPLLDSFSGGTPSGTNGLTQYTDQAIEFDTSAGRSYHPVVAPTAGTTAASSATWLAPWSSGIGTQTMYCTDCHDVHGSNNVFLLNAPWSQDTGTGTPTDLCFNCHNWSDYADLNNSSPNQSGFRISGNRSVGTDPSSVIDYADTNLHIGHSRVLGGIKCGYCHTAIPHGYQNRALLIDQRQNDTQYYMPNAKLIDVNFPDLGSANWSCHDCHQVFDLPGVSSCRTCHNIHGR